MIHQLARSLATVVFIWNPIPNFFISSKSQAAIVNRILREHRIPLAFENREEGKPVISRELGRQGGHSSEAVVISRG